MNTPEPCLTCAFLYADCMHDEDPSYQAECWLRRLGTTIGDANCSHYVHWEKISRQDGDARIEVYHE